MSKSTPPKVSGREAAAPPTEPRKPRPPTPAVSGLDFWAGRIGNALLVASIVFAAFVAYTFSAPTVYRSSALLAVEGVPGKAVRSSDPADLERRLRDAVLDDAFVARLRGEFTSSGGDPRTRLREGFEIHTLDGRAFSVAFRDADRFRAQRVTTELAAQTARALPSVLAPELLPEQAREAARQKHVEELMNFLAAHPEITSAVPAPPVEQKGAEKPRSVKAALATDPAIATLHKERKRVEARLAELHGPRGQSVVDNPYDDENDIWTNPRKLRRRLSEIDRMLEARRSAILRSVKMDGQPEPTSAPISPELRAEWQRLLEAVSRAPAAGSPAPGAPALTVKIARAANMPRWPIEPNRVLLLWLGALLGLVSGTVVALRPRPKSPEGRADRPSSWPRASIVPRSAAPLIARSLPLRPRAAAGDSPLPLALVRPLEQPSPRQVPVRFGGNAAGELAARRNASWRRELAPLPPATRAQDPQRSSRPRDTLLYGTADTSDRSLAITLRFPEPGAQASPRADAEPLGVEAVELADWRPEPSLQVERRRPLAAELATVRDEDALVIGVLGAPREAKSRVAGELALALAELGGGRVLLLEGNFTRPACAETMRVKMPRSFGFSRQLEALTLGRLRHWSVVRCTTALDVLGEGIMRTPGLMVGQRFADSVQSLRSAYAFIVIDGPSLRDGADCRNLDPMLGATIFVHSRQHAAELSRAGALFEKKRFSWTIACD